MFCHDRKFKGPDTRKQNVLLTKRGMLEQSEVQDVQHFLNSLHTIINIEKTLKKKAKIIDLLPPNIEHRIKEVGIIYLITLLNTVLIAS